MSEQDFWNEIMIKFMQHSLLRFSGQCIHALHQATQGADFIMFNNGGGVPFDCWLSRYDEQFKRAVEGQRVYAYRLDGVLTLIYRPIYDEDTGWLYWERT